jgi:F420-0:gamma-glutamyl ligase-like protein
MDKVVKWRDYVAIPLKSEVWRPKTDFKNKIVEMIKDVVADDDYVVVSEKALSVALERLYDESLIESDPFSKIMTYLTTRVLWGALLGRVCKLSPETVCLLRSYPLTDGARHKKLALRLGGPFQAFKPTSEAGIDTTNVPGYLVSLPLEKPFEVAREIQKHVAEKLKISVRVVIADSDKCYRLKPIPRLILTSRKTKLPSSVNLGFLSFLVARALNRLFSPYATPLGFSPRDIDLNELLIVSELADRARGPGAGRTILEVEKKLGVKATEITWETLNSFPHYPVVVVKKVKRSPRA